MKKRTKSFFTLLELLVSMGVFAILMLALMQFFSSAQNIWTNSNTKTDMFDEARLAMNIIATDLQCLYYEDMHSDKKAFFALAEPQTSLTIAGITGRTAYTRLAFATLRPEKVRSDAITRITEVFYRLNSSNYTLEMRAVSDREGYDFSPSRWCTDPTTSATINDVNDSAFGTVLYDRDNQPVTPDDWTVLLSNVLDFKVLCRDRSGNEITADRLYNTAPIARIPYLVEIHLTVMDPEVLAPIIARNGGKIPSTLPNVVKNTAQSFVRTVIIDRGQN